ncbi:MAG: putative ABC transporter permease [Candidatus Shapirobacteria bacterium]|jgi:uncharacterized membrane protein
MINSLFINQLICYFAIYSFLGWILEFLYVGLIFQKKFVDVGFLFGPFCPIYGVGVIFIIIFLQPFAQTPLYFLIAAIIMTSSIEYLTGTILEAIFKTNWWDYSKERFNLNGKICLKSSIYFGVLALFIFYFVHPHIHSFILYLFQKTSYIFPIIFLAYLIIDTIFSIISAYSLRKIIIKLNKLKEEYQNNLKEFIKKRNEIYLKLKKKQQYLLTFLPNFKIPKIPYLNKK